MNTRMNTQPESEHEWTIHSINIHGAFFERWCQKTLIETGMWSVKSTNYPVEFPPPNGPFRGSESALDIRAELRSDERLVTLLIECKKNNPDFVNWVLFPRHPVQTTFTVSQAENFSHEDGTDGWKVAGSIKRVTSAIPIVDEARETRGSYAAYQKGDKTRTSNAAVTEAAHQVALATQAIILEERHFSQTLGTARPPVAMPWRKQVFLPMIVTSARIFTCQFDPSEIDPSTGEIPYPKATINEVPYLIYEYALPRRLQAGPENLVYALTHDSMDLFMRMHIFIVNSANFAEVLRETAKNANGFLY